LRKALQHLLASHYPQVAADLLEPLTRLLQLARTSCEGDSDKFLILLLIGLRTSQHREFRAETPERIAGGEIPVLPSLGLNVRSIAESLAIPKETVRRKVQDLIEAGWVVRQDGNLHATARAYQDLTPLREEIVALATRYYEVVAQLESRA
jgi:hypothetical protein